MHMSIRAVSKLIHFVCEKSRLTGKDDTSHEGTACPCVVRRLLGSTFSDNVRGQGFAPYDCEQAV